MSVSSPAKPRSGGSAAPPGAAPWRSPVRHRRSIDLDLATLPRAGEGNARISGEPRESLTCTASLGLIRAMTEGIDYYDRRRTERDDLVRDGAQFADYLAPGAIVDSAHPSIVAWTRDVVGDATDEKSRALRLYYAVRDRIRYDPYNTPMLRQAYLASTCLAKGQGYCVNKAGLLAAVLRASGIAARLGYAD